MAKKEKKEVAAEDMVHSVVPNSKSVSLFENVDMLEKLPKVTDFLSTGSTLIDLALSGTIDGGIPVGRCVQLTGLQSTGKSLVATAVAGSSLRKKFDTYYCDIERTFDPAFAIMFGCDATMDGFHLEYPDTMEEFWDGVVAGAIDVAKKTKKPATIILDSVASLTDNDEVGRKLSDGAKVASKAKILNQAFRKYLSDISQYNITIIFIDQLRDAINTFGYGDKRVTTAGHAIPFFSSVRVMLSVKKTEKNAKKVVTGQLISVQPIKNKVAPPKREVQMRVVYDYGIDDISVNLYALDVMGGGKYKDGQKHVFNGETKLVRHMVKYIEDAGLERELQLEVQKVWDNYYPTPDRKVRTWS